MGSKPERTAGTSVAVTTLPGANESMDILGRIVRRNRLSRHKRS